MPTPAPGVFAPRQRPPAKSTTTNAVRNAVAGWVGRALHVQHISELLRAYHVLAPHAATLYDHSPHAPRLLHNLTVELTRRGALPC